MKANFDKAAMAARSVMLRTSREKGVSYEHVYKEIERAIQHGLMSCEPEAMLFWSELRRASQKAIPTPEDVIIHISEKLRQRRPLTQYENMLLH